MSYVTEAALAASVDMSARRKHKEVAKPIENIVRLKPSELPRLDRSGRRKSRRTTKASSSAIELATKLEDFISLPSKYWNDLLEVICLISTSPAYSESNPGYTRITQEQWNDLFPQKKAKDVKTKLCEIWCKDGKAYAYRLKPEVIERIQHVQTLAKIESLEALRKVPDESGIPYLEPLVPVNLEATSIALDAVANSLQLNIESESAVKQVDLLLLDHLIALEPSERRDKLERIENALTIFVREAQARDGFVLQTYRYSKLESRFYGVGSHHIQRTPRLARTILFHGCTDIDIQCCHHAILLHLSEQKGLHLPALSEYVSNRNKIRDQIQIELGVPRSKVKEILLGTINGMCWGSMEKSLPGCRDNKAFLALKHDIAKAIKALGLKWNRVGAHLNKYEQRAVEAALQVHQSAIVGMHDGWITTEDEDLQAAETAIEEAIGFPLKLEKKLLHLEGFPEQKPLGIGAVEI